MVDDLGPLDVHRKSGQEQFHTVDGELDANLLGFWQWSTSDLVDNTTRGTLAEYIVALALGIADQGVRVGWAAYDLETPDGIKVEVKASAYLQSWHQTAHSDIRFSIRPASAWDEVTNEYTEKKRHSDVYVFALLHHKDKATVNPLNLDQWTFYVLATSLLDQHRSEQDSITLSSLLSLQPVKASFGTIETAIREALA